jgi:hypothetical protein
MRGASTSAGVEGSAFSGGNGQTDHDKDSLSCGGTCVTQNWTPGRWAAEVRGSKGQKVARSPCTGGKVGADTEGESV